MTAPDDDGAELADLAAVRAYAIHNARFTLSEEIKETGRLDPAHRIEIADEHGQVLATVRFSDAVRIEGCAAPGPHALDQS